MAALDGAGTGFYANPEKDMKRMLVLMYEQMFMELCIDRFKWVNLPKTIDPAFLEKTLYFNGLAVFFKDPVAGYLALQASETGRRDMQNNPISYAVFGNEYLRRTVVAVPTIRKFTDPRTGEIVLDRRPADQAVTSSARVT